MPQPAITGSLDIPQFGDMAELGLLQQLRNEEEADGDLLHGDVLEAVVSRLSALDLLPASRVSKLWHSAVLSSLRLSPRRPSPWLILCLGSNRRGASTHAFDPLSRTWRAFPLPPASPFCTAEASAHACSSGAGAGRLYALSSFKLAVAEDPFGTLWRNLEPPRHWRTDPVVALVGARIVVAGGASELEDDSASVEVRGDGGEWEMAEPMPEAFRWSPAISGATSERRLYVVEKRAPFSASWFDPEVKRWGPTRQVRFPDPTVRHVAIGFLGGQLVVVGVGGNGDGLEWRAESLQLWTVDEETMQVVDELGEMPRDMVAGMEEAGGGWGLRSVGFLTAGGFAYVYNPLWLKEFFLCQVEGGGCRWERVPGPPGLEERPMGKVVFGCAQVAMDDLKLVGLGGCKTN